MGKIDFDYPLSPKMLHKRYDEVFAALKKGLNPLIVGLPQSSRSAYLKFIVNHDNNFLKEFIDPTKFSFIQIETKDISENRHINTIAYEIFGEEIEKTEDPLITTAIIKKRVKDMKDSKKIVFIIYELEEFEVKNPETYKFILDLLGINKHSPKNFGFQAIFISSPQIEQRAIFDKTIYFKLFDKNEMEYTRKRLEYFRDKKIDEKVHRLASKLSFGHYLLYKFLSDLSLKELKEISILRTHHSISQLLDTIWNKIQNKEIVNKFTPLFLPTLLPPVSKFIRESDYGDIVQLTSQERIIFDYLKKEERILSRDEVAEAIWGINWTEKYSDWAIDKLFSKLKTKLLYSKYRILTIRGRGYQLTSNGN